MTTLEQRLEKLEKKVTFYRRIATGVTLILCAMAFFAFNEKFNPPDVLQARRIEIVDDYGKVYVRMEKNANGGYIENYNNNGKFTFNTNVHNTGHGQLYVGDGRGYSNLYVGESTAGGGYLGVLSDGNYYVAEMGNANSDGGGYLEVNDKYGNSKGTLFANKNGEGAMEFYNSNNTRIIYMGATTTSWGGLWLYNNYGQQVAKLPN